MISLYDKTTLECSKLITNRYSTSFSLGISTLNRRYHLPICAIYGFVRLADEIVDTFLDHDKETLLNRFEADTYEAIERKLSLNPVLHAFQLAVNEFRIDHELIAAFLHSMRMDLNLTSCTDDTYDEYIYGSAEVVGLMCLRVFLDGDQQRYEELKPSGRKLGAAFQKVNFLRDMKSDFQERGRVYFPGADFGQFGPETKAAIEADIAQDFREAYIGIKQLPDGVRLGVYLAYVYYLALFRKIKSMPPARILNERIRVPDAEKAWLLLAVRCKSALKLI
jgi:phytoene/squalene synthetase